MYTSPYLQGWVGKVCIETNGVNLYPEERDTTDSGTDQSKRRQSYAGGNDECLRELNARVGIDWEELNEQKACRLYNEHAHHAFRFVEVQHPEVLGYGFSKPV